MGSEMCIRDRLAGPVYYRVLVTGQPVPRRFTDALVDRYLAEARPLPEG